MKCLKLNAKKRGGGVPLCKKIFDEPEIIVLALDDETWLITSGFDDVYQSFDDLWGED